MPEGDRRLTPYGQTSDIADLAARAVRKYERKKFPVAMEDSPKQYVDAALHAVADKVPEHRLTQQNVLVSKNGGDVLVSRNTGHVLISRAET